MKRIFSNIQGLTIIGLLFAAASAFAQDGLPISTQNETKEATFPDYNIGEDKGTFLEGGEAKNSVTTPAAVKENQTSIPKQSKPKVSETKATEKEQPDPLSFNFLYALIQKFKFSDMVD